MRVIQTLFACWLSAVCLAGLGVHAGENLRLLTVALSFDRPINASAAPLVVAMTDGLFFLRRVGRHLQNRHRIARRIASVASGARGEFAVVDSTR